ncbi:Predicted metal-dependent protease of the PAD1/JAB1 superfamily [hydrothermal vent metagenome]|uniref:Predicted metal-dependent protease of the PAD1/JAB1 superfamily n=1 Tax=hydrothermal vent metagenome TaxID=652676 RepID=A0A3B1BAA7_9ZZZZ
MDPGDVRKAFEESGKNGLDVIGFYHSHPDHEVYWSNEDHKAAMWAGTDEPSFPDAINVVISVGADGMKGMAAFVWSAEEHGFIKTDLIES